MNIETLRGGAAFLAEAAIHALFPQAQLLRSFATPWGFCCTFRGGALLPKNWLSVVEDKMRSLSLEKLPFSSSEMVPSNAIAFFSSLGQGYRQEELEGLKGSLVPIVRGGEFVSISNLPTPQSSSEVKFFKLLESWEEGELIRIAGTAFFEKEELKKFVKAWESPEPRNHRRLIEEGSLLRQMEEGGWMWLPEGEKWRHALLERWRGACQEAGFSLISAPVFEERDFARNARLSGLEATAQIGLIPLAGRGIEGLLDPEEGCVDALFLSYTEENLLEKLTLCLQLTAKFLTMSAFDVVLGERSPRPLERALQTLSLPFTRGEGKGVTFRLRDRLGRAWVGPKLTLEKGAVSFSVLGCLERFFALHLEVG